RRRHTRFSRDWSSDVCSSDLVTKILKTHTEIQYFGIDISALMHKEAVTANQTYIQNNRADFQLYDGLELPYPKNLFDGIFSVNTVYFWENPQAFLHEIYREIGRASCRERVY